MFSAQEFVVTFNILTENNNDARVLYELYLKKFRISANQEQYDAILEYHYKFFDFVEHLRELSVENIKDVFIFLDKTLPCTVDITIMMWCLPRSSNYNSKIMYDAKYYKNIQLYNHKLISLVDLYFICNFCTESLIKTNSIPVHCIDLLWYWMTDLDIEFKFSNSASANYIGIEKSENIIMSINMETIFNFELGKIKYKKGSFQDLLNNFLHHEDFIECFSLHDKNYVRQRNNILNL